MQEASSWIWTLVTVSIFYDLKLNTTNAAIKLFYTIFFFQIHALFKSDFISEWIIVNLVSFFPGRSVGPMLIRWKSYPVYFHFYSG